MREEYDFLNGIKNPYAKKNAKISINIRLDKEIIDYFKDLSDKSNIPYQSLINSFLADCAKQKKGLNLHWG